MLQQQSSTANGCKKIDFIAFFECFGVLIFMVLLILFFQTQNGHFLTGHNTINILTEVSIYGIMADGMTLVILTAGIDLSVGSILAVSTMTAAFIIKGDNLVGLDPEAWGNELVGGASDLFSCRYWDWFLTWTRDH